MLLSQTVVYTLYSINLLRIRFLTLTPNHPYSSCKMHFLEKLGRYRDRKIKTTPIFVTINIINFKYVNLLDRQILKHLH
jgi:hypothetical protein